MYLFSTIDTEADPHSSNPYCSRVNCTSTLPLRKLNTEKVRNLPKDTQLVSGAESDSQTGPLSFRQFKEVQERWQSLPSFNKYLGTANSGLGTERIRL